MTSDTPQNRLADDAVSQTRSPVVNVARDKTYHLDKEVCSAENVIYDSYLTQGSGCHPGQGFSKPCPAWYSKLHFGRWNCVGEVLPAPRKN